MSDFIPAKVAQVGGTHYTASYQHWDMVRSIQLGYFEGQVTRYACRAFRKNGLEDLQKALSYVQKMLTFHPPITTLQSLFRRIFGTGFYPMYVESTEDKLLALSDFFAEYNLLENIPMGDSYETFSYGDGIKARIAYLLENDVIRAICFWRTERDLLDIVSCLKDCIRVYKAYLDHVNYVDPEGLNSVPPDLPDDIRFWGFTYYAYMAVFHPDAEIEPIKPAQ